MNFIDPTYLRSIADDLAAGAINKDNPAALPDGLAGIFEKALPPESNVKERKKFLEFFSVWALLKKEVSAAFVVPLLGGWSEEDILDYIARYSKWFNSPESGKYVLFHERFRIFVLQKINANDFVACCNRIIALLEKNLANQKNNDAEIYALEFINQYLLMHALIKGDNSNFLQSLDNDVLRERQIKINRAYTWVKDDLSQFIRYAIYSKNNNKAYEAALKLLTAQHQEQNSFKDIYAILESENTELLADRLNAFSGVRKAKMILLLFHELLLTGRHKFTERFIRSTVNVLFDLFSLNEEKFNVRWPEYYPLKMIYRYQAALFQLGVDRMDWWKYPQNITGLLAHEHYNLSLLIKIIKQDSQQENYIHNIEKILDRELQTHDIARIAEIIDVIDKNGEKRVNMYGNVYKNIKVEKYNFKIECLNKVVSKNIALRNEAIAMQRAIITTIPSESLKLQCICAVMQHMDEIGIRPDVRYCHILLNEIVQNNNELLNLETLSKCCDHIHRNKKLQKRIYVYILSHYKQMATTDSKLNVLEWICLHAEKYQKQKISRVLAVEMINIINDLKAQSQKTKRLNPVFQQTKITPNYNTILLRLMLNKNLPASVKKMADIAIWQIDKHPNEQMGLILETYAFLKNNEANDDANRVEEQLRKKFANSGVSIETGLKLMNFHISQRNNEPFLFWMKTVLSELLQKDYIVIFADVIRDLLKKEVIAAEKLPQIYNHIKSPFRKIAVKYYLNKNKIIAYNRDELLSEIKTSLSQAQKEQFIENALYLIKQIKSSVFQAFVLDLVVEHCLEISDPEKIAASIQTVLGSIAQHTKISNAFNDYVFRFYNTYSGGYGLNPELFKKYVCLLNKGQLKTWEKFNNTEQSKLFTLRAIVFSAMKKYSKLNLILEEMETRPNSNGAFESANNPFEFIQNPINETAKYLV